MNLIFLTMSPFDTLADHNIYADLLSEFAARGHKPYLVSPIERRDAAQSTFTDRGSYAVLRVRVGNTSGVSLVEKGLSTVAMEGRFIAEIRKYLRDVPFGLILYSTPPVTFARVIQWLKEATGAPTYLLLKDIFPQNAVDLGMFSKGGLIYRYFRSKEKKLYALSDAIGCMSQANVDYLLSHEPQLSAEKVHINPNSITPHAAAADPAQIAQVRRRYDIPDGARVFLFGGNMGKPQGMDFVVQCLRRVKDRQDCFFVLCGTGSDYGLPERYVQLEQPKNVRLIHGLPKTDYDELLSACDVGLLFLDHRFTIPNFPSRLLSYLEQAKPALACTDACTDVGTTITEGGFGWWCPSGDAEAFVRTVDAVCREPSLDAYGGRARAYLLKHYLGGDSCDRILSLGMGGGQ